MGSVYGISGRARDYVRRRATATMSATCRIERVNKPTFDQSTGTATAGSRSTIYEGVCRVWEVSGGAVTMIGDEDITTQSTQLSIPWDATPLPKKHDEVQILTNATDVQMVGKRFKIEDYAKAGELRATRRFTITGLQENER